MLSTIAFGFICSLTIDRKLEMKFINFVILIALCLRGGSAKPQTKIADDKIIADVEDSIRLPSHTRPINYDIEVTVNIHNGSSAYSGNVFIAIIVDVATDVITLHNKGLSVESVTVRGSNNVVLPSSFESDAAKDFLIISVETLLTVDDLFSIEIQFNGEISSDANGFYKMSYRDAVTNEVR